MRGAVFAVPVAKIISVSEVEVSLSTVIELNERSTDFDSIVCSAPAAIGRVGEHVGEHRRHVGGDHAGALRDAVEVTIVSPIWAKAVATLG